MKHTALPNLGAVPNGHVLRIEMAKTISYLERQAARRQATPPQVAALLAFFEAAATRVAALDTPAEGT